MSNMTEQTSRSRSAAGRDAGTTFARQLTQNRTVGESDRTLPTPVTEWRLKYGALVIAAIGFSLIQVIVLEAVSLNLSLVQFVVTNVVPLVLGLSLVIVGLSLTISTLSRSYVNTVALWCVLGTLGMGIIATLTLVEASFYISLGLLTSGWTSSLLANTLLGGAIGGLLLGLRSASNRQHRHELVQQTDRATVLNRILRHEVLNKLTLIRGHVTLLTERTSADQSGNEQADGGALASESSASTSTTPPAREETSLQAIERGADQAETAVEDIGFLTRLSTSDASTFRPVDLRPILDKQIDEARHAHPEATVKLTDDIPSTTVWADSRLERVFNQLVDNAVRHNDTSTPQVEIGVEVHNDTVRVCIADNGSGLPDDQQAILEGQQLPEYDDPSTGFGLPIVRLLVTRYGGTIDLNTPSKSSAGTAITLALPRAPGPEQATEGFPQGGVAISELRNVIVAALVAGVAMGGMLQGLTDTLPAIGGLYGVQSLSIGWILHLFHSVVFGVGFAALLARPTLRRYAMTKRRTTLLGVGYGLLLWLGAAGILMPIWLNAVGIPAPVPLLTLPSLVGHVLWGVLLGALYSNLRSWGAIREGEGGYS